MPLTPEAAFNSFSQNSVDLNPERVRDARNSRQWLVEQIERFQNAVPDFPTLYLAENDVQFGSFSRRTKIQPLDDIDFMIVLSARGSTYEVINGLVRIHVPTDPALKLLCDDDLLNSRKVLDKLKNSLSEVPQYSRAEIHRRQEAVTLNLSSYEWNFDIVPAFLTETDNRGRSYYLIPDGQGNWKLTDPRIDQQRISDINQNHDGKVLGAIRLIKYWNQYCNQLTLPSYLIENIALNYFGSLIYLGDVGQVLRGFFAYLSTAILGAVADPKGIQGDLNELDVNGRLAFFALANEARNNAANANVASMSGQSELAISWWKRIFGAEFPDYG